MSTKSVHFLVKLICINTQCFLRVKIYINKYLHSFVSKIFHNSVFILVHLMMQLDDEIFLNKLVFNSMLWSVTRTGLSDLADSSVPLLHVAFAELDQSHK